MSEFWLFLGVALLASFVTYLGAPLAERVDASRSVISAALHFAGGVITALVAFSLMPPAVRGGAYGWVVLTFFLGGVLYVVLEAVAGHMLAAGVPAQPGQHAPAAAGLYVGILVDLAIDGIVIGIGSTLTLATGLLLALGLAISTAPLTFVTTATAKRRGVSKRVRHRLAVLCFLAVLLGALLGYLVLRDVPLQARLIPIALASGFLITTVVQGLIPEANREGEPGFAGILYVGGLSTYALLSLVVL